MTRVEHRSNRQDWETPPDLFRKLDEEFHFTLDVCASAENAKCARFFTVADDGLVQDWTGEVCWMNPPYGRGITVRWVKKAYESAQAGATVVCLLPSRTGARWFWDYCFKGEVRYIKGRVKFVGAESGAPFDSAIVIFRPSSSAPNPQ